jgi:hypothetical protein
MKRGTRRAKSFVLALLAEKSRKLQGNLKLKPNIRNIIGRCFPGLSGGSQQIRPDLDHISRNGIADGLYAAVGKLLEVDAHLSKLVVSQRRQLIARLSE